MYLAPANRTTWILSAALGIPLAAYGAMSLDQSTPHRLAYISACAVVQRAAPGAILERAPASCKFSITAHRAGYVTVTPDIMIPNSQVLALEKGGDPQ